MNERSFILSLNLYTLYQKGNKGKNEIMADNSAIFRSESSSFSEAGNLQPENRLQLV
jgi:hypothetical protein